MHGSRLIILFLLSFLPFSFPPLCFFQLDATMVEELDSTLNEGKEIATLYQEINKTLSTRHLQFESVSDRWLTAVRT